MTSGIGRRLRLYAFATVAVVGLALAIIYARWVAPGAKTSFELAVLVFAVSASTIGWLNLIVAWLTYRLEAGKVPRPDVVIVDDGKFVRRLSTVIDLTPPRSSFDAEIEARRSLLEEKGRHASRPEKTSDVVGVIVAQMLNTPSAAEMKTYREETIPKHLLHYEDYLKDSEMHKAFWRRCAVLLLAFTNEKAGAPAEGVRVSLHIRDDEGLKVLDPDDTPDEPREPPLPAPPRSALFGGLAGLSTRDYSSILNRSLGDFANINPHRKVSGPEITHENSVTIKYEVDEVLHNMHEDTREEPVLLFFERPGEWTVDYVIHARNLPAPKRGRLSIVAFEAEPPE